MIYEIELTTAADSKYFLDGFAQRFSWLKQRGCKLLTNTIKYDKANCLKLEIQLVGSPVSYNYKEEDLIYIFKHQLAEFLAEHIINDWENKLTWKEITKKSRRILLDDHSVIMEKAMAFLRHCNSNESLNLLMNYGRKNKISHHIFEYIYYHNCLMMEGFINFCLRDYLTEIRFAVDLACEELRNEKEYNEFIKLLRYFVDTQPPLLPEVNVMADCVEGFILWDSDGTRIEQNNINHIDDIFRGEIGLDDLLISILITAAPRRIILHNTKKQPDSEALQMIKKVFDKRISFCDGCERCLGYSEQELVKTHKE